MRAIKYIVIHCTATPQSTTVAAIKRYWREVLKWNNPGYHIIVKPDGSYERLAEDTKICNGVAGHNANAIHISYIGGVDGAGKAVDNRTTAQKSTLTTLVRTFKNKYPSASVLGHRDFPGVKKSCPCFNAREEYT